MKALLVQTIDRRDKISRITSLALIHGVNHLENRGINIPRCFLSQLFEFLLPLSLFLTINSLIMN